MASAAALGLETSPDLPENQRHDIVLIVPGRGVVVLEVKASSIPTADQVRILAERPPGGAIPVLVADQIPASVRVALNDSAVSWLDRRGHLRLTGDGLYIDADVPPVSRQDARTWDRARPDHGPFGARRRRRPAPSAS